MPVPWILWEMLLIVVPGRSVPTRIVKIFVGRYEIFSRILGPHSKRCLVKMNPVVPSSALLTVWALSLKMFFCQKGA